MAELGAAGFNKKQTFSLETPRSYHSIHYQSFVEKSVTLILICSKMTNAHSIECNVLEEQCE